MSISSNRILGLYDPDSFDDSDEYDDPFGWLTVILNGTGE